MGDDYVWITKDSGKRVEFDSGMVRDTNDGKVRYDLTIPPGLPLEETLFYRWADLLRRGAIKYEENNWTKASGQKELDRFKESAFRHFMSWFVGETDEDHGAAVLFGIQGADYVKYRMEHDDE